MTPIIVLNWNGIDDTIECVNALLRMDHSKFRVILVDNGSEPDESAALATAFGTDTRIIIRRNETNLGFTRGINRELKRFLTAGDEEYIALLNNDAVPDPGWLSALEDCASRTGAGLIASRILRYDAPEWLDNAGHLLMPTGEILPRGAGERSSRYGKPSFLVGACAGATLISRDLLEEIGLFDLYFRTGYEDAEFGLRAYMAGYPTCYCPDAIVRHKISRSVNRIRDFAFAVKLQQDINYTWFKLSPTPLWLASFPLSFVKLVLILGMALVLGRTRLFRVQLAAWKQSLKDLHQYRAARRNAAPLRRLSSATVLRSQLSSAHAYYRYLHRFLLKGAPTVFER